MTVMVSRYEPADNRSQIISWKGHRVFLDAYNANPSSMKLALDDFARMDQSPKMAFIGHMLELGETSAEEHQRVIDLLADLEIPAVLAGEKFAACDMRGLKYFPNAEAFHAWLESENISGHLILLKGSRGIAMEEAVKWL